ncbi:MAG: peptidylprolyl isomerase [Myxococcota bacterium]
MTLLLLLGTVLAADAVVARVNDEVLTAAEVRAGLARARAAGGEARVERVVEELIDARLLSREGTRRGLARDPVVAAAVESERRRLAAEHLVETEVASVVRVDDAQLRELYHAGTDTARFDLIVLGTDENARAALGRLRGGADVAAEARSSYDVDSKARGGDSGTRARGQLEPALADEAFRAPVGAWVGPIPLALGFAVLRVRERTAGDEAGFAARREELRRFADAQARTQARRHVVSELRRRAGVTVDEAFLRSTGKRLEVPPADVERAVATVGDRAVRYRDVVTEIRRIFGAAGGHASGPTVKLEIAWALADRLVLEQAALARGAADAPEVRAALRAWTRDALARALAARLRSQGGDEAIRREIARLRKGARISIDRAAAQRAAAEP